MRFDMSFGVRYSYDEKEFSQEVLPDPGGSLLAYKMQTGFSTPNGPLTDKQDWDEVTWRVVANWRPNDDNAVLRQRHDRLQTRWFRQLQHGAQGRIGTSMRIPFGLCVGDPATDRPGDFGPETVTSYEIGYKGTVFGGRTQIAANAFFYDYEDMQAIFGEGLRVIVDNVGQVDGTGVELEVNTVVQ